jgi:hypothetical protein
MYARKSSRATAKSDSGQESQSENGPRKLIAAQAPVDLIARMREIAESNDRTFSAEVRRAMRDYVEAYDEEEAA